MKTPNKDTHQPKQAQPSQAAPGTAPRQNETNKGGANPPVDKAEKANAEKSAKAS